MNHPSFHPLPTLLAHADWSTHPKKRWLVRATRQTNGRYLAHEPALVGPPETLIARLQAEAGPGGPVLLGFDFPIGLPLGYAEQLGVGDFLTLLPQLGRGKWADFYQVAERAEEISLHRPFYPRRPGGKKQQHLLDGLGVASINELRRQCDLPQPGRRAAAPLFWTLGGQQVGKAAISGWQTILVPALLSERSDVAIWPFDGPLFELFRPNRVIIVETYPAECYGHLGLTFARRSGRRSGKRVQASRASNASALLKRAQTAQVDLAPGLQALIEDGFGPGAEGEDPFDATIGLFGMLNVILGYRPPGTPDAEAIRKIEGWILGQQPRLEIRD